MELAQFEESPSPGNVNDSEPHPERKGTKNLPTEVEFYVESRVYSNVSPEGSYGVGNFEA